MWKCEMYTEIILFVLISFTEFHTNSTSKTIYYIFRNHAKTQETMEFADGSCVQILPEKIYQQPSSL